MTVGARLVHELGRIRVRLLLVNLVVVLVPLAGIALGRLVERQLLGALQRDMTNQAFLAASLVESELGRGVPLGAPHQAAILERAARRTRTRLRLIDPGRGVVADSHAHGPPEGKEPYAPWLVRMGTMGDMRGIPANDPPSPPARPEVLEALAGNPSAHTRVALDPPAVFLFVAEPIRHQGRVVGVMYAVRSTNPVLDELHRIRRGLIVLLGAAVAFTALSTLLLAWTISRPLGKLSSAATRIAGGERNVGVPVGGGGEITELARSVSVMTERLDARLRYISEFAADVAHEFKSPLTSIRGAAELLLEGAADDPSARDRFLRNIELDVARLDRLVSRLLELGRIEAATGELTVLDLRGLVEHAVERAQTPEGTVALDYAAKTTLVKGREADLEAALHNLIDNALRFSPDGEQVAVRVIDREPRSVVISIHDRGLGIEPANLPRVFDRFFTTEADRDGTGLGLAIVKSVALAHGGRITVESSPHQGTIFSLELPTP
ncbi:MAG: HAMP domain-containing protein [Polyangiaceae bacterium]|nr:HAMP domain-containing protein [Polyangiaceae bacterium]